MGLIISTAFNGYDRLWPDCVASHEAYAARHGYAYSLVGKGFDTDLSMEVAWIKVPLLIAALDKGHDWVMFIDSDAAFDAACPRFETVEQPGKSIYLANGHSGRPNSGVMILRRSEAAGKFLVDVMTLAGRRIPKRHDVGWGENGAVIHVASRNAARAVMDPRWNNNHSPDLPSYVYHYSAGPMRVRYEETRGDFKIRDTVARAHASGTQNLVGSPEFMRGLSDLLTSSTASSDQFELSGAKSLLLRLSQGRPSWLQRVYRTLGPSGRR